MEHFKGGYKQETKADSKRQKLGSKQEDKSLSQLSQQEAKEVELELWMEEILTRQDGVEALLLNAALCV